MGSRPESLSSLEKVEAILGNPAVYALGDLIPEQDLTDGGRPRDYPAWTLVFWEALLTVYGTARTVEAELAHPLVWQHIRRTVRQQVPDRPELHLPSKPMRRHHYLYGRNRYLTDPNIQAAMADLHRRIAASQAVELGLLDPGGKGSWTHPDLSRMIYADGKVITPLFRAKPDEIRVDTETGERLPLRTEADAALHWEGTGEAAWGTKFVVVATRSTEVRGRIILDTNPVPTPGGEAAAAMEAFERIAPHCPGAQGVIYDTALRGVHHQKLMRDLGLLSVNKVTAEKATANKARRDPDEQRTPKSTYVETKAITTAGGQQRSVDLYAVDGAIGIAEPDAEGDLEFIPLSRVRTHRNHNATTGKFRWYNDYRLPDWLGGTITVRLHQNSKDDKRGFNRTENVRQIPSTDPDFAELYARRNDAESINRHLDDTLWLRRAHSVGFARQQANMLGFAICVNAIATHEHRERQPVELAA